MDLVGMHMRESRLKIKMTILHRPGGVWDKIEIGRLATGLVTEVSQHHKHPEHIILFGHYTKKQTLKAILGGVQYSVEQITGVPNIKLPFHPGFS